MLRDFQLLPESASGFAREVDALTLFLLIVSAGATTLIFTLVLVFAARYRRRHPGQRASSATRGNVPLELVWTIVPLCVSLFVFVWGARLFVTATVAPAGALEMYVIGKQWMWKIRHPEGPGEINTLHVPVGRPVKLRMVSEDVIHSFYIPAFRIKADVLPGRFSTLWFEATRPGVYHLFCAEYCGTAHSKMVGQVVALDPVAYADWLSGGESGEPMAAAGERLYRQLGCDTCHDVATGPRCPSLQNLFGRPVRLRDGRTVTADETYLRESIVDPGARVVAGFEPIMPTYRGQLNEEGLLKLTEYIKSLSAAAEGTP